MKAADTCERLAPPSDQTFGAALDGPQEPIRPAVEGTLRALRAAHKAGVERVVLTSSCVAIYKDSAKPPAQRSTRDHWTDPDGPRVLGFTYTPAKESLLASAAFLVDHEPTASH